MPRYLSTTVTEYGTKRIMLVENSQDHRFAGGVVCYMFRGSDDGPCEAVTFYDGATVEQVIRDLEELSGRSPASWSVIPDQVPGCRDDWVAPVRQVRDEWGDLVPAEWEKFESGQWIRLGQA